VLDLGAGTGKLTGVLARHADAVVAVEPDLAMLAELRRAVPGGRPAAGRAEHIPLRDASVDAVLAGQSAHWFDLSRAIPEIARVLRPGGVLAGLWNTDDDRADWVAGLAAAAPGLASVPLSRWRAQGGDDISRWLAAASAGNPGAAAGGPGSRDGAVFGQPEPGEFGHWQLRTAGSLVATIATHSTVLLMEPAQRDQVLSVIRDYLASRPETRSGSFRLPIVTCVMRAVRQRA
jgi:SAM-dependent methyltransferase